MKPCRPNTASLPPVRGNLMCVVLTRIYPTFKCIDRIGLNSIRSVLIIISLLFSFRFLRPWLTLNNLHRGFVL